MTTQEFEKLYERYRPEAIRRVLGVLGRACSRTAAEDAIQNAAIYCLENLSRFERLTQSYFNQLAINNARMIARSERARVNNREHGVGDWFDLADVEEADNEKRLGRTPPAPRAQ